MKYVKINFTTVFLVLLMTALVSCDAFKGEPELPIPLEETMSNTGAFLRVLSVESSGFDVSDLSTAAYVFTGEISDVNNGQNITTINFYASFRPKEGDVVPEPAEPILTVDTSTLTIREESGLPSGQFTITLQSILDALGLQADDLALGDVFNVRWEVITEDGTVYSVDDASPAVGGGFYVSPYNANAGVVQSVPQDKFVGSYTITQNNPSGTFNPIFQGNSFQAELKVDPTNGLNGRVFDASYIGSFPQTVELTFFRRQDFQSFTATDNWVSVPPPSFDLGVGCSAIGLRFGSVTDAAQSSFDVDDDSQFTFAIISNEDGDCGGAATQVTFTATKN